MRIVMRGALAVCAMVGFALTASGQGGIGSGTSRAVRPYTAKFKITQVQTLANGTTITTESTELQAEDSQGRHRSEFTTAANGETQERTIFHINDPANRSDTSWVTPGKTVTVRKRPPLAERGQGRTCWSYAAEGSSVTARAAGSVTMLAQVKMAPGEIATLASSLGAQARMQASQITRENLGTQTIQGVVTVGTRITETTPVGAVGNDAPLVGTNETWRSKSPSLVVRSLIDDPRTGKRTRELVELNQGEPDPALFQLPEGYEVVTQEPQAIACTQ